MDMIPQDEQLSFQIDRLNSVLDPAIVYPLIEASYVLNAPFLKEK